MCFVQDCILAAIAVCSSDEEALQGFGAHQLLETYSSFCADIQPEQPGILDHLAVTGNCSDSRVC